MKRFLTSVVVAVLATAAPAFAVDSTCSTLANLVNRPTVTQSACVVAPNHILIEAGYQNGTSKNAGGTVDSIGALIRVGTSVKNLEVDFAPPALGRSTGSVSSYSDMSAGLKYLIRDAKNYQVGAQVNVTAPIGDTSGPSAKSNTSAGINAAYHFSNIFSLKTSHTFATNNFAGVSYGSYKPSVELLARLPQATSVFVEYAAQTNALGAKTASASQFLLGASHAISNRLQVDVEGYTSPNASTDHYHGIGFGAAYQI